MATTQNDLPFRYRYFQPANNAQFIGSVLPSEVGRTGPTGPQGTPGTSSNTGATGPAGPTNIVQNVDGPIGYLVENLSNGSSAESTYILKNNASNSLYSFLLSSSQNSSAFLAHQVTNSNTGSLDILTKNTLNLIGGANEGETPVNQIQVSKNR